MARKKLHEKSTLGLVLGLGLMGGFLLLVVYLGMSGAVEQFRSSSWPVTKGTVVRSEVEQYRATKRRVRFECAYQVEEKAYVMTRRRRANISMSGILEGKQAFVDAHPVGMVLDVSYDPIDPQRATIDPGLSAADVLFPVALAGISCWYCCAVVIELINRVYGLSSRSRQ